MIVLNRKKTIMKNVGCLIAVIIFIIGAILFFDPKYKENRATIITVVLFSYLIVLALNSRGSGGKFDRNGDA